MEQLMEIWATELKDPKITLALQTISPLLAERAAISLFLNSGQGRFRLRDALPEVNTATEAVALAALEFGVNDAQAAQLRTLFQTGQYLTLWLDAVNTLKGAVIPIQNTSEGPNPLPTCGAKAPYRPISRLENLRQQQKNPSPKLRLLMEAAKKAGLNYLIGPAVDQAGIPADRLPDFIAVATDYIAAGIRTPEAMAAELDATFDKKARKYSQALWSAFSMVDPSLLSMPNWDAVYADIDSAEKPRDASDT